MLLIVCNNVFCGVGIFLLNFVFLVNFLFFGPGIKDIFGIPRFDQNTVQILEKG